MNLLPDDGQRQIVDSVRGYFQRRLPLERLRSASAAEVAGPLWPELAALGLFGIGLPEIAGGAGFGAVEEVITMRECGRFVASPAIFATVIAAHAMVLAGDPAAAHELSTGKLRAALGISIALTNEVLVCDLDGSDFMLALGPDRIALYESGAVRDRQARRSLDDTVSLVAGSIGSPALLTSDEYGCDLTSRTHLLLAAQLVGLSEGARDLAVAYAGVRQQFDRPIGSFQAIKHRCADMAMASEVAWAATSLAARTFADATATAQLDIASAKVLAARAAHANADAAIQIHGGIGFQAECDAHRFVKRAFLWDWASGGKRADARAVLQQSSLRLAA